MLRRAALASSVVMVPVTLARVENPDWGNFWRHGWYHLFVVLWLVVVTHTVRTIGGREFVRFWLMGFFPVALLAYLSTELLESQLGTRNLQNGVLVPLLEESIKFLPLVLWTTWLRPKHLHGTLSDFLLLGFIIGAGFSLHEDALYARVATSGFGDGVYGVLFPSFLSTPTQFAIAHAGWTAMAGVGVGLISLHRHRPAARWLGLLLIVAPIVDHAAVNWSGSGLDFMHRITADGDLAAGLLVATIVGAVVHDLSGLRWATRRDGTLPSPHLRGDVQLLTASGGAPRIGRLAAVQRYRRRRNAAFIDLFAVRSVGRSAGDRWRIRSELQVLAGRVGADALAAPESAPLPTAHGGAPADGSGFSRRTIVVGLVVVALLIGLLLWQSGGDGDESPVADVIPDRGGDDAGEVPDVPATGSAPSDLPISDWSVAPTISEPLLVRWSYSEAGGGEGSERMFVGDGTRELFVNGGTLRYQDESSGVWCEGVNRDNPTCFAGEPRATLAPFGGFWNLTNDIPGASFDSRTLAGREASCVFIQLDDQTSTSTCVDVETGIDLLQTNTSVDIMGGDNSWRQEVVEWTIPEESDFALPPEARAVLSDE